MFCSLIEGLRDCNGGSSGPLRGNSSCNPNETLPLTHRRGLRSRHPPGVSLRGGLAVSSSLEGGIPMRVLVVEDDALVAELLCEFLLDQKSMPVGPASTVGEALEAINTNSIDAALLNIRLRGERVFPVCELLTKLHKPFAFVSGSLDEIPDKFRHVPKLEKPWQAAKLAAVLKRLGEFPDAGSSLAGSGRSGSAL
jgi:CheY-like chemotaxis protein